MQTNSVQHLEKNTCACVLGKKQKQNQIVATPSWLVAHADTLGAHTVHWNKCSMYESRAALLQMNMVRTTSWVPFHLASAQLNQPRILSLSSYLLCSSPQTIWGLSWYVRLASHICAALLAVSCFWKVRLASKRKAISLFQKISAVLISARLWRHLAGLVLWCFYTAGLV